MERPDAQIITNYFHELSPQQVDLFDALYDLYAYWNQRINVISRKDFENFYVHHVLHSLGIARIIQFKTGTEIIDVGTGGGFPGIPLAILFPDVRFFLVDSIGKKIRVVREVAESLNLKNVSSEHSRAEQIKGKFDFIISRAVTNLPDFVRLTAHLIRPSGKNELKNGIIYLKGGDFEMELTGLKKYRHTLYPLSTYFSEDFFETKKVIHLFRDE